MSLRSTFTTSSSTTEPTTQRADNQPLRPQWISRPLPWRVGTDTGITIVGAIVAAQSGSGFLAQAIAFLAIALATINVIGGYMVTDRMLGSFKKKEKK